jgi:hypothetical protein
MKVGVAPSTGPLVPCWTVRLWASGELLVKLIVTVPAFAVSVLVVNFKAPDGSAAIASELLALAEDEAADVADVLDVAGELVALLLLAGGLAAELLLLLLPLEPPQALMPSARAIATSVNLGVLCTSHISLLFVQLTR